MRPLRKPEREEQQNTVSEIVEVEVHEHLVEMEEVDHRTEDEEQLDTVWREMGRNEETHD